MNRRTFLRLATASMTALSLGEMTMTQAEDIQPERMVMTVNGPVTPESLGLMLPHEHVLVDFIGAEKVSSNRYDTDKVFGLSLPRLKHLFDLGVRSMVECTPAYIGRDVKLLQRLSNTSGIHLLTNTGYYAAHGEIFIPPHARTDTVDELAARWIDEWENGIEGTGIHPGFIKIGVDKDPLSPMDEKLTHAAARAHLKTGLVIASHTKGGQAALQQMAILKEEGVAGEAFIWVHANVEKDRTFHVKAAEQGAWLEFDKLATDSVEEHVEMVKAMRSLGRLNQTLVSHDAVWYMVDQKDDALARGYDRLFTEFLPQLKGAGFTDKEVEMLTVTNPAKAFTVGVRRASD